MNWKKRLYSALVSVMLISPIWLTDHAVAETKLPENIPDWRGQQQLFQAVMIAAQENKTQVIEWIKRHRDALKPTYLYYLSTLILDRDEAEALEWYALGYMRAMYDVLRCEDKTARGGLPFLSRNFAGPVSRHGAKHKDRLSAAGLRALKRKDLFLGQASPMWICIHGISSFASSGNKGVVDKSTWPDIARDVRSRSEKLFRDLLNPARTRGPVNPVVATERYPVKFTVQLELNGRPLKISKITKCKKNRHKNGVTSWSTDKNFNVAIAPNGALRIWMAEFCRDAAKKGFPDIEKGSFALGPFQVDWLDDHIAPTVAKKFSRVSDTQAETPILRTTSFRTHFERVPNTNTKPVTEEIGFYYGALWNTGGKPYRFFMSNTGTILKEDVWSSFPWAVKFAKGKKRLSEFFLTSGRTHRLFRKGQIVPYRYLGDGRWALDPKNIGISVSYFVGIRSGRHFTPNPAPNSTATGFNE